MKVLVVVPPFKQQQQPTTAAVSVAPFIEGGNKISPRIIPKSSLVFNPQDSKFSLRSDFGSNGCTSSLSSKTPNFDNNPQFDFTLPSSVENDALDNVDIDELLNSICPLAEQDNATSSTSQLLNDPLPLLSNLDSWLHDNNSPEQLSEISAEEANGDAVTPLSYSSHTHLHDLDISSWFDKDSVFFNKNSTSNYSPQHSNSDCPIPFKRMRINSTINNEISNISTTSAATASFLSTTSTTTIINSSNFDNTLRRLKIRQQKNNEASRKSRALKKVRVCEMKETSKQLQKENKIIEDILLELNNVVERSKEILVNHFPNKSQSSTNNNNDV
jgi:hypothetical protein